MLPLPLIQPGPINKTKAASSFAPRPDYCSSILFVSRLRLLRFSLLSSLHLPSLLQSFKVSLSGPKTSNSCCLLPCPSLCRSNCASASRKPVPVRPAMTGAKAAAASHCVGEKKQLSTASSNGHSPALTPRLRTSTSPRPCVASPAYCTLYTALRLITSNSPRTAPLFFSSHSRLNCLNWRRRTRNQNCLLYRPRPTSR